MSKIFQLLHSLSDVQLNNAIISVSLLTSNTSSLFVTGGGLPSAYELVGLHWHWGAGPFRGSEHTISQST